MNIFHKIMLASYYNDRIKDKTSEVASLNSKVWMGFLLSLWSLCIELWIREIFNTDIGIFTMISSLNIKEKLWRNIISAMVFFLPPFIFSKSKEEFEELYLSDFLDYTQTWRYVWIPFIIPIFLMFFIVIN